MSVWSYMEYGAWGLSGMILLWMLFDMIRTDATFSEDYLMSSREGEIEIAEHHDRVRTGEGGHHG